MYPVKLGKCQHVMMTPSMRQISNDASRPINFAKLEFAVLISEDEEGGAKRVLLLVSGTEISLQRVGVNLQVSINKETIMLPEEGSYQYEEDDVIIAQIYKRNGAITVISEKYELKLVYDGERVQVQVSKRNGVS